MAVLKLLHISACLLYVIYLESVQAIKYEQLAPEINKQVNTRKTTWKPGVTKKFVGLEETKLHEYLGLSPDYKNRSPKALNKIPTGEQKGRKKNTRRKRQTLLPTSFDWRQASPCASFSEVRDQQNCGSCWAVSSASVMSDRYCLYTGTAITFSAKHVCTCVNSRSCCKGGYPDNAFAYYCSNGVVNGGDPSVPSEISGCQPYPSVMTNSDLNKVMCPKACVATGEAFSPLTGSDYYTITSKNPTDIMNEIYVHGSVVATFAVYQDFYNYVSGVYQHVTGSLVGYHAVRVIGWGVENGVNYWQCVNSWGKGFGEQGFFKILRGTDECEIEDYIYGALPPQAFPTSG